MASEEHDDTEPNVIVQIIDSARRANGDAEMLQELRIQLVHALKDGANPNIRPSKIGWLYNTPLIKCLDKGLTDFAWILLYFGADPNMPGNANRHAISTLRLETAEFAPVLATDPAAINESCIMHVCAGASYGLPLVKTLLALGGDPNHQDPGTGWTPARHAVESMNMANHFGVVETAIVQPNTDYYVEILRALLDYNADLSIRCKEGKTPVEAAVEVVRDHLITSLKL